MSSEKRPLRIKTFRLRIGSEHDLEDESLLNDFLESVDVEKIESSVMDVGANSFWSVLVTYRADSELDLSSRDIVYDAHEPLDPEEDSLFMRLSHWRYHESRRLNLPPHLVFHNAHLKNFVKTMPATIEDLKKIRGVPARKIERYGEHILAIIREYRREEKE